MIREIVYWTFQLMNNLKKLGLTALAGSLVATSAVAGALDVSGTAKVKYQATGSERVSANPWSDATTIFILSYC